MTPKASASSAVSEIFKDRRMSTLDVRRNGLQDFSIFSVVGICDTRNMVNFHLGKSIRIKVEY